MEAVNPGDEVMSSTILGSRSSRPTSGPRRFLAAIGRALIALWRALPRVEPITGPFADGPGERSVIINGHRLVVLRRRGHQTP